MKAFYLCATNFGVMSYKLTKIYYPMSDPVSVTYVLISISMRYSLRGGGWKPPLLDNAVGQVGGAPSSLLIN